MPDHNKLPVGKAHYLARFLDQYNKMFRPICEYRFLPSLSTYRDTEFGHGSLLQAVKGHIPQAIGLVLLGQLAAHALGVQPLCWPDASLHVELDETRIDLRGLYCSKL
jgi:hypothetical protein